MIEHLLPPDVVAVSTFSDVSLDHLFPEELAVVSRAVEKRQREFATVRWCARQALARLDIPAVPILPTPRGAPQFPAEVTGSMTHCEGFRAAAVGLRSSVLAIGIDAEPALAMPFGTLEAVSLPRERRRVAELSRSYPGVPWDRLLFSAKESVYKVWWPIVGVELGFEDALITFSPDTGTFSARLLVPGLVVGDDPLQQLAGRWICSQGIVATAIALTAVGRCTVDWSEELAQLTELASALR